MAAKKSSGAPFSIGMKKAFIEAPPFRPGLNLGCCFDIPTGRYERGLHGHYYHTGGLNHITGIGGRGNTYKSALAIWMLLTILARFLPLVDSQSRDTEFSQSYQRFQDLAQHLAQLAGIDLSDTDHFMITSQGENSGNAWFKQLKERLDAKREAGKDVIYTTPFFLPTSEKPLKIFYPTAVLIDSLSAFTTDVVDETFDKNEVGAGGANMVFARAAAAKSQMIMLLPSEATQAGAYVIFTAHMGDGIDMDPYNPTPKKLAHMKGKVKFKNVPENITFLTNNLWMIQSLQLEQTKEKTVTYPKDASDNVENDTDLQRLTVQNLRGKHGPSGLPFDVILSQREGVLVSLTEYHYLKSHGRYGLGGDNTKFYLEIYPDVELTRTTIRGLCNTNPRLARAMEITSEMCQLKFMKPEHHDVLVTPKALYKALVEKGYDLEKIFDSRGYWLFQEAESEAPPFLSTLDILHMAAGTEEHPWQAHFKKS